MKRTPGWAYAFWIAITGAIALALIAAVASAAAVVPLIVIGFPLTLAALAVFLLIGYIRHKRR